ncbi:MAG: guanylate kinase [Bdellovibrionota bacterium]
MRIAKSDRQGMILALIGPAGSGKTTLSSILTEKFPDEVKLSISVTSRPKRESEVDGESYIFVSRDEFMKMVANGEFFEWEETHGNLYGTLKSTVENSISAGEDLVLDIDIRGALNFKRVYPRNTIIVFIAVPSFVVLMERLKNRGYISSEELNKRLKTAEFEYQKILELHAQGSQIDYVLINDKIENAEADLIEIRRAEICSFKRLHSEILAKFCEIDSENKAN